MEKIDGVRDSRAGMEKVSYRNNKPGELKKFTEPIAPRMYSPASLG